ncbi:MAG: DUF1015 domain-containing protein [Candidatus Omnitrophica bacterium]|nr:DUF1015 domain-containing protein [Candidatus Omnitrophota bacterium]
MATIKPFKAVHYNPKKIDDMAKVVCPPYDVISPKEQAGFYQADPFNYIRILLGVEKETDNSQDNKYTRARKIFVEWLEKNILITDEKPCIYVYQQEYKVFGQKKARIGFLALMRLRDKEGSKVFPHENTHMAAKVDRLSLLRSVKASLCPIFVCYSDRYKRIDNLSQEFIDHKKPFIDVCDADDVHHILWRVEDPGLIEKVQSLMNGQPLFIADGHHRYEVAMEYCKQRLEGRQNFTGEEPFNYVMTYFTNLESKDLSILPIHRVVKKLPKTLDFLEEFFRIDKVGSINELSRLLPKAGKNENAFGLYTKGAIKLLRLKNKLLIDQHIHEGGKDYRSLDATILKYFIFDRVKIASEDIIYKKDLKEATDMVDAGEASACFVLNPIHVDQLKAVALNGERMPPKTTYFYPKVLSGLTIYNMETEE